MTKKTRAVRYSPAQGATDADCRLAKTIIYFRNHFCSDIAASPCRVCIDGCTFLRKTGLNRNSAEPPLFMRVNCCRKIYINWGVAPIHKDDLLYLMHGQRTTSC
ncbi:hypothetical protein Leryth_001916 [Lithospermum erythrorhizon]|nr:hypothetical protein Leryth_001916 [Lithospermum erythrorhizon]